MRSIAEAIHLGSDDIPWISSEDGTRLQLVYANTRDNVWIAHALYAPGFRSQRHKHTGPVFSYTVTGRWRFLEYHVVATAGSFLYEPAGVVHTQHVYDDNCEPTETWSQVTGSNLNLDADDRVQSVVDAESMASYYLCACEAAGLPRPDIVAC